MQYLTCDRERESSCTCGKKSSNFTTNATACTLVCRTGNLRLHTADAASMASRFGGLHRHCWRREGARLRIPTRPAAQLVHPHVVKSCSLAVPWLCARPATAQPSPFRARAARESVAHPEGRGHACMLSTFRSPSGCAVSAESAALPFSKLVDLLATVEVGPHATQAA